jgi:ATP adenylyltransferase
MRMNEHCDICKLLDEPFETLIRTRYWRFALGDNHAYLGRGYLTLLDHKSSLSELTPEEWQDYTEIVRRIESAYRRAFDTGPFNWSCLMNNAFQKVPAYPHVHWHLWPRHKDPVEINGETFVDELYGHHYDNHAKHITSPGTVKMIADAIRTYL